MKKLLFFVDEGGFDDLTPLFRELAYQVDFSNNPRKSVKISKKNTYDVLVAEFSYNPEFRDRVSNIESLLATLQSKSPNATIIILYDPINQPQLNQFLKRYVVHHILTLPINQTELRKILSHLQ